MFVNYTVKIKVNESSFIKINDKKIKISQIRITKAMHLMKSNEFIIYNKFYENKVGKKVFYLLYKLCLIIHIIKDVNIEYVFGYDLKCDKYMSFLFHPFLENNKDQKLGMLSIYFRNYLTNRSSIGYNNKI